jgi:hypothetical protein
MSLHHQTTMNVNSLRNVFRGDAGTGCTVAASADDIAEEQWVTIRDENPNKNDDRVKWKVSQSFIDASRAEGFSSGTRAELHPMSTAASVLHSFPTRNSNVVLEVPADTEVTSPEKNLERAAIARMTCGVIGFSVNRIVEHTMLHRISVHALIYLAPVAS